LLVVDASCLAEVLVGGPDATVLRHRLAADEEQAAPHVIDVEVFGVIRRQFLGGRLDPTAARQAVEDMQVWPGERYGHAFLLPRAWELRETIRGWDAMYVALAEALGATLLTRDSRLAGADGPECAIETV
jgi:predicted nucleic acid-binding protein